MKDNYSYLKDPRALAEIRKHKWLESQKAGYEIGFATAALDWINKYGVEWKKNHSAEDRESALFLERRRYRRFKFNSAVELVKNNALVLAENVNLSLFGLLCRSKEYLPLGSQIDVRFSVNDQASSQLLCRAVIERAFAVDAEKYEFFLRFDDSSQQKIQFLSSLRG